MYDLYRFERFLAVGDQESEKCHPDEIASLFTLHSTPFAFKVYLALRRGVRGEARSWG